MREGGFGGAGLFASAGFVEVNESVQFGLAGLDALEMSFEKFRRQELFGTEAFDDFLDREVAKGTHG